MYPYLEKEKIGSAWAETEIGSPWAETEMKPLIT
jgi:hypothetical protein